MEERCFECNKNLPFHNNFYKCITNLIFLIRKKKRHNNFLIKIIVSLSFFCLLGRKREIKKWDTFRRLVKEKLKEKKRKTDSVTVSNSNSNKLEF